MQVGEPSLPHSAHASDIEPAREAIHAVSLTRLSCAQRLKNLDHFESSPVRAQPVSVVCVRVARDALLRWRSPHALRLVCVCLPRARPWVPVGRCLRLCTLAKICMQIHKLTHASIPTQARTRVHTLMHSCRRVDAGAGSNRLRPACRHKPTEYPTATGPELRPRAAGQAAGQAVAGTQQPCTGAKREQATHRERLQRIFLGRIS